MLLFELTLVKAFVNPTIFNNNLRKLIDPIHKNNINNQLIKLNNNLNYTELNDQEKYDLSWYVIGRPNDFNKDLKQITIWSKNYVVWKVNNTFHALDDVCSHKSASLSRGKLINNNVMCPYHGYEFNTNGTLVKVPGLNFKHTCIHDVNKYNIIEKNGWIYLNTYYTNNSLTNNIFFEEETINSTFTPVYLNMDFNCFSRTLSENSLDVMHIGFVHTFGNKEKPEPYLENPPKLVNDFPYHYKTSYLYESGRKSMAKKVFLFNNLTIENEFILPHTTVARVKFGELVSTVITFALPINMTHSKLFVKTYRNFWNENDITEYIGDKITHSMMYQTMLQDKYVVESIDQNCMDGKFNMKFDKLQNTYVSLYKKLIYNKLNQ